MNTDCTIYVDGSPRQTVTAESDRAAVQEALDDVIVEARAEYAAAPDDSPRIHELRVVAVEAIYGDLEGELPDDAPEVTVALEFAPGCRGAARHDWQPWTGMQNEDAFGTTRLSRCTVCDTVQVERVRGCGLCRRVTALSCLTPHEDARITSARIGG